MVATLRTRGEHDTVASHTVASHTDLRSPQALSQHRPLWSTRTCSAKTGPTALRSRYFALARAKSCLLSCALRRGSSECELSVTVHERLVCETLYTDDAVDGVRCDSDSGGDLIL
jgi:hypothetical protein